MIFSFLPEANETRVQRWYFGGLAATSAHIFVHPFDVIKVGLQMAQVTEKYSALRYLKYVVASHGILSLYCGLLSSMRQQFMYSASRFGIHQKSKEYLQVKNFPFVLDLSLAAVGGLVGAFIKNPMEIINTRMQADLKLPPKEQFNYKSATHALKLIVMVDGYRALFAGVTMNITKAMVINISQICFYDRFKRYLLEKHKFTDTIGTHVTVSATAGLLATIFCQPIDVIKLRYMTGDSTKGIQKIIENQFKLGLMSFYRGGLLTFVKTELHTVLMFVVLERMRLHYGLTPRYCTKEERARRILDLGECIRGLKRREVIQEEIERKQWKRLIKLREYVANMYNEFLITIGLRRRFVEEVSRFHKRDIRIRERFDKLRKLGGHSKIQQFLRRLIRIIMTKREREQAEKDLMERAKKLVEEEEDEEEAEEEGKVNEEGHEVVKCKERDGSSKEPAGNSEKHLQGHQY